MRPYGLACTLEGEIGVSRCQSSFQFSAPRDLLEKLAPFLHASRSCEVKANPITTCSHTFSWASCDLLVITWSFDWFTVTACVVCDWLVWLLSFSFMILKLKTGLRPAPLFHPVKSRTKTDEAALFSLIKHAFLANRSARCMRNFIINVFD